MSFPLVAIDEINRGDHYYLDQDDICYYFKTYTSGQSYNFSDTNSLITNLKMDVNIKDSNPQRWNYKCGAINECATYLNYAIDNFPEFTFVPVPPSKTKANPLYDNRLLKILQKAFKGNADISELITMNEDMESSHSLPPGMRPTPISLRRNMTLNAELFENSKDNIIVFDDVLTTGAHFKACKNLILNANPDKTIIGVFLARRGFAEENEEI